MAASQAPPGLTSEPLKSAFQGADKPAYEDYARCIHCGLCATSCPTFALLGNEMDSPRGRIYLMRMLADGEIGATPTVVKHLDRCLGCRACETACLSGLQYGKLIEAARAGLERVRGRSLAERLLRRFLFRMLLPSREMLTLAAGLTRLYQKTWVGNVVRRLGLVPARLARLEPLMPEAPPLAEMRLLPREVPPLGEERSRVAFFGGCLQSALFGEVNRAAVRVLAANGARVAFPAAQTCCGALQAAVSGCGAMLHEYGDLLGQEPALAERARAFGGKVMDVTVFLDRNGVRPSRHPDPQRVAYHHPCHLFHALKVREEPLRLLSAIRNIETVPLEESDWCCGSAGSYNITQTDLSMRLLDRKVSHIRAAGAPVLCTGNPGCQIQIAYGARKEGLDLRVVHPVVLLDEAYRAEGVYDGAALP